ncbi:MAG: hypothetical protein A3J75_08430, partial [Acidobacteria bacterium RBG_16_68_9]
EAVACYAAGVGRPADGSDSEHTASELAMERQFPGITRRLDRIPLTVVPTRVHPLEQLGRARGIASLWVKRDDESGRLYGGNKPRKLEFLLGEARRRGSRTVMTFGGIGTHHGLATAICARRAGMKATLVLVPQPVTDHVRRCLLLDEAYGAALHYATSPVSAAATAVRVWLRGALRGDPPFIIPTGGTSSVGVLGYVNAAFELAEQVRQGELPEPTSVFLPLGSGGTVAGLALGLKLAGVRSRVVGVLVTDILPPSRARLARLARGALRRLRAAEPKIPEVPLAPDDFTVITGHLGQCYGAPTEEGQEAQRLLADLEGIHIETTYTAKCLAALLQLATEPPYRGNRLLFWNTYSSVDPGAGIGALPDFRRLPEPFHRFFI